MGTYGVVMGDLIDSRSVSDISELHTTFNTEIDELNLLMAEKIASPMTITLGDEFQGLTHTLVDAAMIARRVRLSLMKKGVLCRFVIGLVELKTPLNGQQAWNMMGPGLAEAREMLNEQMVTDGYAFTLQNSQLLSHLLDALGLSAAHIESGWTKIQLEDVWGLLEGESVEELAEQRGVSTRNVYKSRRSAHYLTYLTQWSAIIAALAHLDESHAAKTLEL